MIRIVFIQKSAAALLAGLLFGDLLVLEHHVAGLLRVDLVDLDLVVAVGVWELAVVDALAPLGRVVLDVGVVLLDVLLLLDDIALLFGQIEADPGH